MKAAKIDTPSQDSKSGWRAAATLRLGNAQRLYVLPPQTGRNGSLFEGFRSLKSTAIVSDGQMYQLPRTYHLPYGITYVIGHGGYIKVLARLEWKSPSVSNTEDTASWPICVSFPMGCNV